MSEPLPFAFGGPPLHARLRVAPEDFVVDEQLGFAASGSGEHWLLHIEKRNANTAWAAGRLARFAGVAERELGYAGLKDRHALTRQYFSLPAKKGANLDWSAFADPDVRVLAATRHARKLQRGALIGNRFELILREVAGDQPTADRTLARIAAEGVPNYFGEQRFGRGGGNVAKALALFAGRRFERKERSLLISAARSELFNALLAARVEAGNWQQAIDGDVFQLDRRSAIFGPEAADQLLRTRLANGEIHPTGPLWGQGELRSQGQVAKLEHAVVARYPELAAGLIACGLSQERRALRVRPQNLSWQWPAPNTLAIHFALPAGAYATTVLRELAGFNE
ncbi:MAG: tRNA pseudouridine(13) synthase TruD [Lysobacterales bacterium]